MQALNPKSTSQVDLFIHRRSTACRAPTKYQQTFTPANILVGW